ncbi:MAK10-like protein [Tanacetum coccineum]
MGDKNPIRTLGDYSKPSHEGYRNTIELPEGKNVVPLRSDTIRLVQNGCSFHEIQSEDPSQHLYYFLKLVDSLDLNGDNRERTRLRLFKFSLRDQASNWLERLPVGSISKGEDLTTCFLAQLFLPGKTAKLCNDILMFQKHQGESLSEAWTRFKDLLQKVPHHGIDLWLQDQENSKNPSTLGRTSRTLTGNELNPSRAHKRDSFSTYSSSYQANLERTLSEFDSHQERRLSSLGAQLGRQQDGMINKISTLWKVFSEKLDDTSTRDTTGNSMAHMNVTSTDQIRKEELQSKGIKSPSKLPLAYNICSHVVLEEQNREPSSQKASISSFYYVSFYVRKMKLEKKRIEDEFEEEIEEEEEEDVEYFDTFPTLEELGYHEWLLKYPKPSWVKAKIKTKNLNNVKFSSMIGHFVKKQAYIDLESPVNVMSRLHYNWIMSGRLEPRKKLSNPMEIYNFVGRVRNLKVFVSHFTYECDFIVLEDTTSVIDHDLGAVVFGKPFVEKTRLIYDKKEGTVAFKDDNEKLIFKMPHKIEMFKNVDFTGVSTDRIPPFVIGGNDDGNEKTHYSDSLNLGPKYKYDESVCKAIRSLMRMKNMRKNKGEVT